MLLVAGVAGASGLDSAFVPRGGQPQLEEARMMMMRTMMMMTRVMMIFMVRIMNMVQFTVFFNCGNIFI